MVLAQLLTFFRDESRSQQDGEPDTDKKKLRAELSPDPSMQQSDLQVALGNKTSSQASMKELMRRTPDHLLLSERESRSLRLSEILSYADKQGFQKIVEIIRAHAKLPAD